MICLLTLLTYCTGLLHWLTALAYCTGLPNWLTELAYLTWLTVLAYRALRYAACTAFTLYQ
ncbi:MAG: hypothetical protein AAFQ95_02070, partial [Cyanobacteria bacterium J06621_3]